MTEAEWLTCTNPQPMLEFVVQSKASDRKLRLFAVACCRRVWHFLFEDEDRKVIDVAERFADKVATNEELDAAGQTADNTQLGGFGVGRPESDGAAFAALHCTALHAGDAAAGDTIPAKADSEWRAARTAEEVSQAVRIV